MINSTSESLKDSVPKVGFRLMALLGQLACENTQKLQSHDCPCDCRSIVFRKIYIFVYVISACALSLTLRLNYILC